MNELVFGFVAAVGVDLSIAEKSTEKELKRLGYTVILIRVTQDVFRSLDDRADKKYGNYYDSTTAMMDIGDDARKSQKRPGVDVKYDAVALGIAASIKKHRELNNKKNKKVAYLVHSLRHPDEVRHLRNLYQRGFYLIGVHAPAETRREYLMKHRRLNKEMTDKLMDRDKQEDVDWGQKLVDTFHLADVFFGLNNGNSTSEAKRYMRFVQNNVRRFIEIVFSHPNRTPTFGEYAMFLAFSASLRSADLSRQVGAVITRKGEILGAGANDCPKANGGLYWPTLNTETLLFEDTPMGRDYTRGVDSNRHELIKIKNKVLQDSKPEFTKILQDSNLKVKSEKQIVSLLLNRLSHVLELSPIRDLTEFGRVVHAEMEALLSCARKGVSTLEAILFSTTFPCHNCAKHIIAAGIKRVIFIEPYLKSKALDMYEDDAIEISYATPLEKPPRKKFNKVRFEPFVGIGPRRFLDLFSMDLGVGIPMVRKEGKAKERAKNWSPAKAEVRIEMSPYSYLERENRSAAAFQALAKTLKSEGL